VFVKLCDEKIFSAAKFPGTGKTLKINVNIFHFNECCRALLTCLLNQTIPQRESSGDFFLNNEEEFFYAITLFVITNSL